MLNAVGLAMSTSSSDDIGSAVGWVIATPILLGGGLVAWLTSLAAKLVVLIARKAGDVLGA